MRSVYCCFFSDLDHALDAGKMTHVTQYPPRRRRQNVGPDELCLPVVNLGASLKPENQDLDEIWTYSSEPSPLYRQNYQNVNERQTPASKSPEYKNIYELSRAYKTSLPLNKGYWKIPGLSKNLIGDHSKGSGTHLKEKGVYEAKFRKWYNNNVHENTVILPPMQTSTRENVYDAAKVAEKNYIWRHTHVSNPFKRFSRSEIHLPRIYSNCLGCRECRRIYTNEIFTENYLSRNNKSPMCCKSPDMADSSVGIHHCDVLGERYCKNCIEKRNKRFSRQLENSIFSVTDKHVKSPHYNPHSKLNPFYTTK